MAAGNIIAVPDNKPMEQHFHCTICQHTWDVDFAEMAKAFGMNQFPECPCCQDGKLKPSEYRECA